jgi:hypothetical protein
MSEISDSRNPSCALAVHSDNRADQLYYKRETLGDLSLNSIATFDLKEQTLHVTLSQNLSNLLFKPSSSVAHLAQRSPITTLSI